MRIMQLLKKSVFLFLFVFGISLPGLFPGMNLPLSIQITSAESLDLDVCPNDYYDYYQFIFTVRSENTRNQSLRDLIDPSYCQVRDILLLEEELNELKDSFRTAAFNCENTTFYKAEFNRLLMEQYFVRNVQKTSSEVIREQDEKEFEARNESILAQLKEEMFDTFVIKEKRVGEVTFESYFSNWSSKYDDRIADYYHCEKGAWAELMDPWKDFVETVQELSEFGEGIDFTTYKTDHFDADLHADEAKEALENANSTARSVIHAWKYLKSYMNQKSSDVEPPTTIQNFSESEEQYTISNVFNDLGEDEARFRIEQASADRLARYAAIYGEGGAVATTDMQRILEELNRIIQETNTKDFANILKGVSMVYDKQCN